MKLSMRGILPALAISAAVIGATNAGKAPAAAAGKIYDVGIYYDVTPSYPDPYCPIHIRFHAEVSSKELKPGATRDITYHWETGKGKVFSAHTLTIPPDMTFTEPTFAPGQTTPDPRYAPTPIPRERNQSSNGLDFHQSHSFRDHVLFVITSPVHEVTNSNALDILCH